MNELNRYDIGDLQVGMTAAFSKTITKTDIILFAGAPGDNNAIHINEEFAKTTPFEGRIANRFLTASTNSAAIANRLPGPGSIYMSQQMKFVGPVRPGDTVQALARAKDVDMEKSRVLLETICSVESRNVVEGEALIRTASKARREAKN